MMNQQEIFHDFFMARVFQESLVAGIPSYLLLQQWMIFKKSGPNSFTESLLKSWDTTVLNSWQDQCDKSLDDGVVPLFFGDSHYPTLLAHIPDPPLILETKGYAPEKFLRPSLAVVGSREPAEKSLTWMQSELRFLCQELKIGVVSGGARGVDLMAHQIAMTSRVENFIVLPSGFGHVYPSSLRGPLKEFLAMGAVVVSEFKFDHEARKHDFKQRNRLISGLSIGTLIVEAREQSGTLMTAYAALSQNRPVFVLPFHPLETKAHGNLKLLKEGATCIYDTQDLEAYLRAEFQILKPILSPNRQGEFHTH